MILISSMELEWAKSIRRRDSVAESEHDHGVKIHSYLAGYQALPYGVSFHRSCSKDQPEDPGDLVVGSVRHPGR